MNNISNTVAGNGALLNALSLLSSFNITDECLCFVL